MNVLFVTLDQFRGDCLSAAGHPSVRTPTLDQIAAEGVRLARHFSQAAPCSPGRAALYTGTYQMNNRVVANGSPLSSDFDNLATMGRRAGYRPTLFGYTDQGVDPRAVPPEDPRLEDYAGILPGFELGLYLPEDQAPWVEHLRTLGYEVPYGLDEALAGEPDRPAEHSLAAFLTDGFLHWLDGREGPWFAHLSYLRPHPPYGAAGEFATRVDPATVPLPLAPQAEGRHPLHELALAWSETRAPADEAGLRQLRAHYYGAIEEVDHQLGRVVSSLRERGEWEDTLVVVTSDHGDQLGDHGLVEKLGYFPQSFHVIGLWRDPREPYAGTVIERFTENVDWMPTLAVALGLEPPRQCDGRVLQELLDGSATEWRQAAHYEWDWRFLAIGPTTPRWPYSRDLSRSHLAVGVSEEIAYVQFGDGSSLCFDLAADPTWRTPCEDPARVLAAAQEMLVWRGEHLGRTLTDMLLAPGRPGHWPEGTP